jgi:hypothetical protein
MSVKDTSLFGYCAPSQRIESKAVDAPPANYIARTQYRNAVGRKRGTPMKLTVKLILILAVIILFVVSMHYIFHFY